MTEILRRHAEDEYAAELAALAALAAEDDRPRPPGWRLSPQAVVTYLMGDAEAISVLTGGLAQAAHFGDGVLRASDVAAGIVGAIVRTRCPTPWCGSAPHAEWPYDTRSPQRCRRRCGQPIR